VRSSSAYIAAIDSLRALAVISVIIYHLHGAWLPGGFAGVDVFFVISGYVISRSMTTLPSSGFVGFTGGFYGRRIRRIVPALVVCLLATSLLSALFIPNAWLSDANQRTGRFAFWGLSNFALMSNGDTYFAPRVEFNPYVHTWSLGVEEQFYLLFPAIFYCWLRFRDSAVLWQRVMSGSLLSGLLIVSLGYSAYVTFRAPAIAYYSLPSRFWELAAGAGLMQLHVTGRWLPRMGEKLQLAVSVALIALCLWFADESAFPFPWAIAGVLGSLGVIDLVARSERMNSVLSWGPAVWVGKISYSLYLWHWPVFVLFRWTVGLDAWGARVAAVGATFLLAWASYTWVENPFRKGTFVRQLAPRWIVVGGLSCVLVAWFGDQLIDRGHRRLTLSVTRDMASWYPISTPAHDAGTGNPECSSAHADCDITGHERHMFISGNSHAIAYEVMLGMLEHRTPIDVSDYRHQGCALLMLDAPMKDDTAECRQFYRSTLEDIESQLKPGDIVFLPSLRLPRFADQFARYSDTEAVAKVAGTAAQRDRQRAVDEADGVLDGLVQRGATVILEAPKPIFKAPAFRCSDWFNRGNPICRSGLSMSRDYLLHYRQPVLDAELALSKRHQHVYVWDPFDVLCPGDTCEAVVDRKPLFFDADHLSADGNRAVYPDFVAFLKSHLDR
jgi:peptidoglycan/LPS O-acetylase OafA/YrhL